MSEYPGLVLAENETRLVASLRASDDRPPLDVNALRALLADAGYAKWRFLEESLLAVIGQYAAGNADFEIQIGECCDASLTLEIAHDAMQAWVTMVPALGGKALLPDEIYLALGEAGVVLKLVPPGLNELPAWIGARLARQQQRAGNEALRFIAERVEGNLLAAHQEILKLGLLHPAGELGLEQVRDAVLNVARYDLDGLREALLAGDVIRLTRTLDGLRQEGEAPPLVLWALTEEVRALAQIKVALQSGQSVDAAFKEARVWGARQGLLKRALQRIEVHPALAALRHAAHIDRLIKGLGGPSDVWDEFLRLGLRLC